MDSLLKIFSSVLTHELKIPRKAKICVAFSGGADSVCLLHMLWSLQEKFSFTLRAHHIRHSLRENDLEDATFAQQFCERLDIECKISEGNAKIVRNVEAEARKMRYDLLLNDTEEHGCQFLATGHHGRDALETALWRLGRGCGPSTLTIASKTKFDKFPDIQIIRPLLSLSPHELRDYLRRNKLEHIEDSSNASDDYLRNKIRHHVIPVYESIFPHQNAVYRSLSLIRASSLSSAELTRQYLLSTLKKEKFGSIFPLSFLSSLDFEEKRDALKILFSEFIYDLPLSFIDDAIRGIGKNFSLSYRSLHLEADKDYFFFPSKTIRTDECVMTANCETETPFGLFAVYHVNFDEEIPRNDRHILTLSRDFSDALSSGRLHICAAGQISFKDTTGREKKCAEALRSSGIPVFLREHWPVLCIDKRVLWILGSARSAEARPAEKKQAALLCRWNQNFRFCSFKA